jgi:peptidoglycan hydrolase-like protein with peptidoglycan-binding domain
MTDHEQDAHQELAEGAEGPEVKTLQELLNAALELKVDGVFGARTLTALKTFQQQSGLAPDGIVGKRTWEKLDAKPA